MSLRELLPEEILRAALAEAEGRCTKRWGKCQGWTGPSSVTWCLPVQEQLKDQLCEGQVMKNPSVNRGAPSLGMELGSSAASCCHLSRAGFVGGVNRRQRSGGCVGTAPLPLRNQRVLPLWWLALPPGVAAPRGFPHCGCCI